MKSRKHPDEAAFIRVASARLIPGDAQSQGAREADVTNFIDNALASPWGGGTDTYASGPWQSGTPQQGYQLKSTPAEFYRTALAAIKPTLGGLSARHRAGGYGGALERQHLALRGGRLRAQVAP